MKIKSRAKIAVFLLGIMAINIFPNFIMDIEAKELDISCFASKEQLMTFNTDDNDGDVNPAKIYFGDNNQEWWIAGSQDNQLVLFAANVLMRGIQFEPDATDKTDMNEWADSSYVGGLSPQTVYSSHYGSSYMRKLLKDLETSYFTNSEQQLMNSTLIYTYDYKNNMAYSISDKLYLAHGDWSSVLYLMVGRNSADDLNSGLRIDRGYWGATKNDPVFWLRATPPNNKGANNTALEAWPTARISNNKVSNGDKRGVKPAFELNLEQVLFGSTIPAVSATGALSNDNVFTLRYQTDTIGSVQVSFDKKSVKFTNVSADTYLVLQDDKGAYAKEITNETSITADSLGIDSFEDYKVWIEKTDDRITYAALATDAPEEIEVPNDDVTIEENPNTADAIMDYVSLLMLGTVVLVVSSKKLLCA